MPGAPPLFPNLHVIDHPLIHHKLTRMRDAATTPPDFRRLLSEIAGLMVYEVSRGFPAVAVEIDTPMERTHGESIVVPVTLVPILRAGIGMTNGILALMPGARVGHIGIYRDEATLQPVAYYDKFPPDVADGPVLLIDPMLATGGSACHAAATLKQRGCRDIRFVCLVCAPPGVRKMLEHHPEVPIHAAALDRELNERGFILPGLGDAGDRIFGTQ